MSARRGWFRFGTPAAVSVVLGVVAGIGVSRATAARPGLSAVLGAVATVAAWALWEAWRAARDARRDDDPGESVTQTASRVRGRLTGWAGPLTARRPTRIHQTIGTVEPGGEVTGADIRGETTGTRPPP
ncbi:MAG TPA: hypothetical protein VFV73_12500 [Streptosporangiaceae bacterium]|nr:hypothetical protein [Streptosporangiaceae bacterium]